MSLNADKLFHEQLGEIPRLDRPHMVSWGRMSPHLQCLMGAFVEIISQGADFCLVWVNEPRMETNLLSRTLRSRDGVLHVWSVIDRTRPCFLMKAGVNVLRDEADGDSWHGVADNANVVQIRTSNSMDVLEFEGASIATLMATLVPHLLLKNEAATACGWAPTRHETPPTPHEVFDR